MRKVGYFGIIVLLWFIFFLPIFRGSTLFDDIIEQFYPAFYFLTSSLKKGVIPFFNHHLFGGFPFLNEPMYLALNPFFILRHLIGLLNNSLYTYNLLVSINYLFAYIFAFLFLSKKFNETISLFGATVYVFSMNHITTIVHPHVFDLIPLIPLILYFLESKPYISAVILGISFHTQHPQKPLYLLMAVAIFYIMKILKDKRKIYEFWFYLIIVGFFLLAYYFQGKDLFNFSERFSWDIKSLLESSYHIDKFISLTIPKFYGSIEEGSFYTGGPYHFYMQMSIYFSVPALILAIYGFIKNRSDSYVRFVALVILSMFFVALGDHNPIVYGVYSSGLIKGLRDPVRALHILPIFVSVLSCYGLKTLIDDGDKTTLLKVSGVVFLLSMAFVVLVKTDYDNSAEVVKFFILVLLFIAASSVKGLGENYFSAMFILLAFADLYMAGNPYLKRNVDIERYYNPPYVRDLKPEGLGYYRINARFSGGMALPRNSGMINGLELTDGYEPLISRYYIGFYRFLINRVDGFENMLYMADVKYYITEKGFKENTFRLSRAAICYNAVVIEDSATFFGEIRNLKPDRVVYLQDRPRKTYSSDKPCKPAKVLNYDYEHIRIEFSEKEPSVLYISLSVYPLWKARINGKNAQILRANWTFMAVETPAGKGVVEIYCDKKPLTMAALMWLTGFILGFAITLVGFIRKD